MDSLVCLKAEVEKILRNTEFENFKLLYSVRSNALDVHVANRNHHRAHGQIVFSDAYLDFFEYYRNAEAVTTALAREINCYANDLSQVLNMMSEQSSGISNLSVPPLLIEKKTPIV